MAHRRAPGKRGTQPVRAAPSQQYGQRQAQEQAQQAVPLPDRRDGIGQAVEAARTLQPVGLFDPPQSDEPVTSGLTVGPGPGPAPARAPSAPAHPEDPAILRMAAWLPLLETAAGRRDASAALQRFVLQLRSSLPHDFDVAGLMGPPDGQDV